MLDTIKGKVRGYIKILADKSEVSDGDFAKRIKKRHNAFWRDTNAEIVRNTIMNAGDPIEKWKDVKNWQRRLSNKYNSREFAHMHNCKLPELYGKEEIIPLLILISCMQIM